MAVMTPAEIDEEFDPVSTSALRPKWSTGAIKDCIKK
jgi:hypothetical protein